MWSNKIKIIILGFFSAILASCSNQKPPEPAITLIEPVSISIVTEPVKHADITDTSIYEAYVIPYTQELTFLREGTFLQFHVRIGDEVKKGDILAELDDEPFLKQVEDLKESIKNLKESHEEEKASLKEEIANKKTLLAQWKEAKEKAKDEENHEGGIDAEKEIVIVEIDIKILEKTLQHRETLYHLQLKQQTKKLEDSIKKTKQNQITAPFDGNIIALANVGRGHRIGEEQLILGIADPNDTRVTCEYIPESDIENSAEYYMYKDGKEYEVTYLPYEKEVYASLILRQETPISTFLYKGEDEEVRQGDYVLICVVKNKESNVLSVPVDALYKDKNGQYAYVDENGRKVKKYVITGITDGKRTEIKEGLGEGEEVYVEN